MLLRRTFEALVPVVLVYEHIVYDRWSARLLPSHRALEVLTTLVLVLSRRYSGRRKREALHLRSLWQQRPASRFSRHIDNGSDVLLEAPTQVRSAMWAWV